jgi:hypothetical protein
MMAGCKKNKLKWFDRSYATAKLKVQDKIKPAVGMPGNSEGLANQRRKLPPEIYAKREKKLKT